MVKKPKISLAKNVLVVGCGALGSPLCLALSKNGHQVSAISRSRRNHPNIRHIQADVTHPFVLDQTFNLIYYILSAHQYAKMSYQEAYVTGLQNTLNSLCKGSENARIIYVSSTSVYRESQGEWVSETSALTEETSSPSFQLVLGETLLRSSSFLEHSIVRFSGLYGKGRRSILDRVLKNDSDGINPNRISNRIHQDDAVGFLVHLSELEEISDTYLASDCQPSKIGDIIFWLKNQLQLPSGPRKTQQNHQPLRKIGNKYCSNRRLLDSGYQFIYPSYQEGFTAEIAEKRLSYLSHNQEES